MKLKIKQMKVESDYYQEIYKRLYSNVEYLPIVESNDITSEEPSDVMETTYDYIDSEANIVIYKYVEKVEETVYNYIDITDHCDDVYTYVEPEEEPEENNYFLKRY